MIERIELVGGKVAFIVGPGQGDRSPGLDSRIMPGSPMEPHPGSSV